MGKHRCDCEFCELNGDEHAEERSNREYLVIKAAKAWHASMQTDGYPNGRKDPSRSVALDKAVEALERAEEK
jgi:hypothetical protein